MPALAPLFRIGLAVLLVGVTPALAAPTARVKGGDIPIYAGPGYNYATIGNLRDGTEVTLEYCTRNGVWCQVTDTGWVLASYLVGAAAKLQVTPPTFQGW